MGTVHVREFRGGLDTRRLPETLPGGALIHAQDCHITQGGEIEQRADFRPVWTAPDDTCVGLAATETSLVVFGHSATPPTGLPANFAYQQLEHPDTGTLELLSVPSWRLYGGELAAVGVFEASGDPDRHIFLDGTVVSDVNSPPTAGPEPFALGASVSKLFVGAESHIFFSDTEDGDDFTNAGAGFIDLSFRIGSGSRVRSFSPYDNWLAVFSRRVITIWSFDADPANTLPVQTIEGFGTFSPRTAIQFRGADVLFYDLSGIRSLRARDSSGAAQTADIGSPIDSLTTAALAGVSDDAQELAAAIVEPLTGRIWWAIGDTIFVLSHYDVTKVTAWTVYKPGFPIDGLAVFNDRVYLRSGDDFYVYGSETGPYQYSSDVQSEAWLPYLDADTPSQTKTLEAVDAAVRGTWEIRAGYDPRDLDASDLLCRITNTTFPDPRVPIQQGEGTHIGLRFKVLSPQSETTPAILSSAMIHHNLDDAVDTPGS